MGEGVIGFGGGGETRNVHIIIITYLIVMQPPKNWSPHEKKGDAALAREMTWVVISLFCCYLSRLMQNSSAANTPRCRPTIHARGRTHIDFFALICLSSYDSKVHHNAASYVESRSLVDVWHNNGSQSSCLNNMNICGKERINNN